MLSLFYYTRIGLFLYVGMKSYQDDNFIENTLNAKYQVCLQTTDIAAIAHSSYGWSIKNGNHLRILSSVKNLERHLREWNICTQLMKFIINLGNKHWVALFVCQRGSKALAYYADSLDKSIPGDIRDILKEKVPDVSIRFSNIVQQKDGYNCGVFALENIKIIEDAIESGTEDDHVIDSVNEYTPTPEQLINTRIKFLEDLQKSRGIVNKSVKNKQNVGEKAIYNGRVVVTVAAVVAIIAFFTTKIVIFQLIIAVALLAVIYANSVPNSEMNETSNQKSISEEYSSNSFGV